MPPHPGGARPPPIVGRPAAAASRHPARCCPDAAGRREPHSRQGAGAAAHHDPAEASATSLVVWRSIDRGQTYTWRATVIDAKDVVPHESTRGPTGEVDLAMTGDGKTVMLVSRIDGDCQCAAATGKDRCGTYRPYFRSLSSDLGVTWSRAVPIPGTGCARPRLLGLGPGRPMLLSGGRMCVANTTGLFVWINPSGLPEGNWTRYSLSYQHSRLAPHPS